MKTAATPPSRPLADALSPTWLLRPPQPLATAHDQPLHRGQPLRLICGPQRVETGWWADAVPMEGEAATASAFSGRSAPRAARERVSSATARPSEGGAAPPRGSATGVAVERGGLHPGAGPLPRQGAAPSGGSAPGAAGERGGDIWWCNISGGTDFCGAFIGGHRELPQKPGVMQCRMLGAAVEAWNDAGEPVIGQVGELVCTQPIPSMPLYLVGDPDGARYRASYFEMYPPGHGRKPGGGDLDKDAGSVWRHGDWLRIGDEHGQGEWCVIYGRSDATINRHGLRMGTSEIYSAVESIPEVLDSMVVDLEYLGRDSYMPLFVVLRPGVELDEALKQRVSEAIRTSLSPRFIPDDIFQVAEIPRTLSGKKQELPIKKLLLGQPLEKVVNRDAMANPASLTWFAEFAAQRASASKSGAASA